MHAKLSAVNKFHKFSRFVSEREVTHGEPSSSALVPHHPLCSLSLLRFFLSPCLAWRDVLARLSLCHCHGPSSPLPARRACVLLLFWIFVVWCPFVGACGPVEAIYEQTYLGSFQVVCNDKIRGCRRVGLCRSLCLVVRLFVFFLLDTFAL